MLQTCNVAMKYFWFIILVWGANLHNTCIAKESSNKSIIRDNRIKFKGKCLQEGHSEEKITKNGEMLN